MIFRVGFIPEPSFKAGFRLLFVDIHGAGLRLQDGHFYYLKWCATHAPYALNANLLQR